MEEARAFGELLKQGWRPRRTIIFCAWDGEEPGLLGSTEWAEQHAEELKRKAVVYINTDSTGKGWFNASGSHTLERFVNDVARSNKLSSSVREREAAGFDRTGRSPQELLSELDEAILAFDIARTTAVADAYLKSGADRSAYLAQVAVTACKFQDDPHNQKITHSTFEEYGHNSTHLKDRLLLASARLLAGWPKMPGERDCYARFMKEWINN